MGRLSRNHAALFNPGVTDFAPKSVDAAQSLAHKSGLMMFATAKTTTKTKPSGGSEGVRA
jgi:hypothetical protein